MKSFIYLIPTIISLATLTLGRPAPQDNSGGIAPPPPPPQSDVPQRGPDFDWRGLSCTDPLLAATALWPPDRWKYSGGDLAWQALVDKWTASSDKNSDTADISNFAAEFFYLSQSTLNCRALNSDSACSLGQDGCGTSGIGGILPPAGVFVIESFQTARAMSQNLYDAVDVFATRIPAAAKNLTDLLTKESSSGLSEGIQNFLGILDITFSLLGGPAFSSFSGKLESAAGRDAKSAPHAGDDAEEEAKEEAAKQLESLQDGLDGAISMGKDAAAGETIPRCVSF
jgi:hypothetical protein